MRRQSRSSHTTFHNLRKDQKRIVRRYEAEWEKLRQSERLACIRRILSERKNEQKLERVFKVGRSRVSPSVRGVLEGGGKRGKVHPFSRASRSRMMAAMDSYAGPALNMFCGVLPCDEFYEVCKDLDERLARERDHFMRSRELMPRFGVTLGYWKKEYEKRKSGVLEGQICPHRHLVVHVEGETVEDRINAVKGWQEANVKMMHLDPLSEKKALEVAMNDSNNRALTNPESGAFYAAKYISKADVLEELLDGDVTCGRAWGRIGKTSKYEEEFEYTLEGLGLNFHEERRVWEMFWGCMSEVMRGTWKEYRENHYETDAQREARRSKFDRFVERVRWGKCCVYLKDSKRVMGEILARCVAQVKSCPF